MLRWIVGVLLVLNVLFLAWSQHWLAPLGLHPLSASEPERLQQQIRPSALTLQKDTPQNAPPPASDAAADGAENEDVQPVD